MDILKTITEEFKLRAEHVENIVQLLDEGNTIPFIARYRKEMTGHIDVHELTGCGDGGSIAGEDHLIGIGSQLPGVFHGKERLFHT